MGVEYLTIPKSMVGKSRETHAVILQPGTYQLIDGQTIVVKQEDVPREIKLQWPLPEITITEKERKIIEILVGHAPTHDWWGDPISAVVTEISLDTTVAKTTVEDLMRRGYVKPVDKGRSGPDVQPTCIWKRIRGGE